MTAFRSFSSHVLALAGLLILSPAARADPTQYPLTIRNCGVDVTFAKAPQRAVAIGQSSTEILLSLGLADRIVGTAVWFGPVLPAYEAANARIPRLADNDPSFEAVVGKEPKLVTAQFEWHVGPQGSVGTREQFAGLGIPTYVSPADCVEKDNSGGGDGVRKQLFSMDLVYQEIRDLARIFDVADRGEALVADLRRREAAAIASVAGARLDNVPMVFWFSSKEVAGEAFVAGKNGVPAWILQQLGARNVITTEEEWPLVSWERIAAANPAIIVMAEMSRRRYAADDTAVKQHFLATDPVASQLEAVKHKHFVVMDVQAMQPSIRAVDGIEAVARGIKSFGLGG
ncbi:ABC transporter substrate-binding protein [Inquilinus sp. CA228]|uniref:ABC transporter substrate-binding protein n=1 Tax=Inquilinus sp. CA228 TaxID=3455609 RepID=UPI003F8D36CE